MTDEHDVDTRLAAIRGGDEPKTAQKGVGARWRRTSRSSLRRGDVLLTTSGALIAVVVLAALAVLAINAASGGGSDDTPNAAARGVATPTVQVGAADHATVEPTATLFTTLKSTPVPIRDCDEIRGTEYRNDVERTFFQDQCQTAGEDGTEAEDEAEALAPPDAQSPPVLPPPGAPPTGPSAPPQATPTARASDASAAIALAAGWIERSGTHTTEAGACTAVRASAHWVVTCNARIAGCQGAVCDAIISVCVLEDLATVRPSDLC